MFLISLQCFICPGSPWENNIEVKVSKTHTTQGLSWLEYIIGVKHVVLRRINRSYSEVTLQIMHDPANPLTFTDLDGRRIIKGKCIPLS